MVEYDHSSKILRCLTWLVLVVFLSVLFPNTSIAGMLCPEPEPPVWQLPEPLPQDSPYAPDEVLVRFKLDVAEETIAEIVSMFDTCIKDKITLFNSNITIYLLKTKQSVSIPDLVAVFKQNANVEHAHPNYIYHISLTPNRPYYSPANAETLPSAQTDLDFVWVEPTNNYWSTIPLIGQFDSSTSSYEVGFMRVDLLKGWVFNIDLGSDTDITLESPLAVGEALVGDFNGDGQDDIMSKGHPNNWSYLLDIYSGINAHNITEYFNWGNPGDSPLVGDFDGDGEADVAIHRIETNYWLVNTNLDSETENSFPWGNRVADRPYIGDMNGDGKDDFIIRRDGTSEWYINTTQTVETSTNIVWGNAFTMYDRPLIGDFNGDGIDDLGIFREETAEWFFNYGPDFDSTTDFAFRWGNPSHPWITGEQPLVGDFNGDAIDDVVILRRYPTNDQWDDPEWYIHFMGLE